MEFVLQGGESSRTSTKESAGPKSRAPSVSPIRERQPLQASAEPPTPWRRSLDGVALHRPPVVPLTDPDRKSCGQIKSKAPRPCRHGAEVSVQTTSAGMNSGGQNLAHLAPSVIAAMQWSEQTERAKLGGCPIIKQRLKALLREPADYCPRYAEKLRASRHRERKTNVSSAA